MSEGYQLTEVQGVGDERIAFKRSDKPGALVEVTINNETVHVEAPALLLAVRAITEGKCSPPAASEEEGR